MNSKHSLLLVGHGSRKDEGNREILAFAAAWRKHHPARRIETCFIEHAEVLLEEGLDRASQDAKRVTVLPLILNAASHVKEDLPEAIALARKRHPDISFEQARHLGMGRDMLAVLQRQLRRLMLSLDMPDPQTTGVVLLGRGSSDAEANGELAKMARWIFEESDHELVDLAFTGVTWPRLESVVQRQIRLGMMQVCIVPAYLFAGVLIERIRAQVQRLQSQYPNVFFALGEPIGFDPDIASMLDARLAEITHPD